MYTYVRKQKKVNKIKYKRNNHLRCGKIEQAAGTMNVKLKRIKRRMNE